jgi:hypothetical protein
LRIPRSINHKPKYDEPVVRLIREDWRPIRKRPTLNERYRRSKVSIIKVNPHAHDRDLVFEKYRLKIHPKARALLRGKRVWERDRSAQIFLMVAELHNAGASPDEIACLLWRNPAFTDKHGQNIDLLNDEVSRILSKLG